MKIISENPSIAVLNAITAAMQKETQELHAAMGKVVRLTDDDLANPANSLTPALPSDQHLEPAFVELPPIRCWEDVVTLEEGMSVSWQGQKYEFDGVVETIDDCTLDALRHDEGGLDEKLLFIRRDDNGKLVSLTMNDLQVGRLTLA